MKKGSEFAFSKIMILIIILIAVAVVIIGVIYPIISSQTENLEGITGSSEDLLEQVGSDLSSVGI